MDVLIPILDSQFDRLQRSWLALIEAVPAEKLYWQPRESSDQVLSYSCGEWILRSAGTVEQTFGGITTNLWDDPFEWTLPETLSTRERIVDYLKEVEATRKRGFAFFQCDADLSKEIVVPSGERQSIHYLLLDTLLKATHQEGCAFATFRLFSDAPVPRF